jgi:hypothetical protein
MIIAPTIHSIISLLLFGSGLAFFYKRESQKQFPVRGPQSPDVNDHRTRAGLV